MVSNSSTTKAVINTAWKLLKNYGLLLFWLLAAWMIYDAHRTQGPPNQNYFADSTNETLYTVWVISVIEIVMLYLILRPWNYHRSVGRSVIALALFAPWTLLNMMISMHASSVIFLHTFWLIVICLILVVLFMVSTAASIVTKVTAK